MKLLPHCEVAQGLLDLRDEIKAGSSECLEENARFLICWPGIIFDFLLHFPWVNLVSKFWNQYVKALKIWS